MRVEGWAASCVPIQEVKSLQMENESLKLTLDKVQVQLDTSLDAQVNK